MNEGTPRKLIAACLGLAFLAIMVPLDVDAASGFAAIVVPRLNLLAFAVCAGLCLRKVGHVRRRHAFAADIQCFAVFVVSCLAFWVAGFDLLRNVQSSEALIKGVVGGFSFENWHLGSARSMLLEIAAAAIVGQIVTGVLAERIKLAPLLIFAAVVAGVVFPIAASWQWGGGWLAQRGFVDFGGATIFHSVAGWAALAGAIVLGGRAGRFAPGSDPHAMENHSGVLMVIGTLILWAGWQGLVGGLRAGAPAAEVSALTHILVNANVAAVSGLVAATIGSALLPRWFTIDATLNGLIAGLVAISADPVHASTLSAVVIGAGAGVIAAYAPILLNRLRIDDVTGSIPAHLMAGIWGTLAITFVAPDANLGVQLLGVVAVGAFTFAASFVVFLVLQIFLGLRVRVEPAAPAVVSS